MALVSEYLNTSGLVVATIIDALIVVLLLLNVMRGRKLGLARQLLSDVGFIAGMFLGVLLAPSLVIAAQNRPGRAVITLVTVIGAGLFVGYAGGRLGADIGKSLRVLHQSKASPIASAILSGATSLILVWLLSGILLTSSLGYLATGLQRSLILRLLNSIAPPPPTVVTHIQTLIDPNGFPQVFVGLEPWPKPRTGNVANQQAVSRAIAQTGDSTVRIEGLGCGGLVSGSGFVVAPDLVMTNAHVVAGITHPFAVDRNSFHAADTVWFDTEKDIALLRVGNLYGSPLRLSQSKADLGTKAIVLGYPDNGPLTGEPAAILDHAVLTGRDIYNRDEVGRPSYTMEASIRTGSSGGPVVLPDGTVIGMVFARSLMSDNLGYALTSQVLLPVVSRADTLKHPVSTGTCPN